MMFGLGGVFVETMKDVTFRLAPLSVEDAQGMISSIKGYPVLEGVRGEKAVDIDKLSEILIRLSQLGSDFPEIAEMDINPVLAFTKGKGAVVVDARIKIR
jgi:acyl-CoA synthetase (NDP forming)